MSVTAAAAYSAGATAWAAGPMRLYGPLADELVARCPIDLGGRSVLDLGAGTGAASIAARGARVVAVDTAIGMLLGGPPSRPPAVVGDALALPFRSGGFEVVIAAFVFNHLAEPAVGVREAGRVAREHVMATIYADDDDHPVKHAVDRALVEAGWWSPGWYRDVISRRSWGTIDAATATFDQGGVVPQRVELVHVPFPDLGPRELVRWRMGMAQCAAFVDAHDGRAIETRALQLLGDAGPVVRSVIFITGRVQ